jgi:hypothetical protein
MTNFTGTPLIDAKTLGDWFFVLFYLCFIFVLLTALIIDIYNPSACARTKQKLRAGKRWETWFKSALSKRGVSDETNCSQ